MTSVREDSYILLEEPGLIFADIFSHAICVSFHRFGFVEFSSPDEVFATIRENNFMKINGRRITLDVVGDDPPGTTSGK